MERWFSNRGDWRLDVCTTMLSLLTSGLWLVAFRAMLKYKFRWSMSSRGSVHKLNTIEKVSSANIHKNDLEVHDGSLEWMGPSHHSEPPEFLRQLQWHCSFLETGNNPRPTSGNFECKPFPVAPMINLLTVAILPICGRPERHHDLAQPNHHLSWAQSCREARQMRTGQHRAAVQLECHAEGHHCKVASSLMRHCYLKISMASRPASYNKLQNQKPETNPGHEIEEPWLVGTDISYGSLHIPLSTTHASSLIEWNLHSCHFAHSSCGICPDQRHRRDAILHLLKRPLTFKEPFSPSCSPMRLLDFLRLSMLENKANDHTQNVVQS